MMQSLLPALYPMLRGSYRLSFTQIGLLTFTFQFTASLLQPLVGLFADRSPRPYSLAAGMGFTLAGLLLLAFADGYALLLVAAALIGIGSSVFPPEASPGARTAAAGGMIGGPLGDRLGSKYIIWASILGVLPFTLLLPHANLFWTAMLTVPIGLIIASAFPAIVVYAQDLLPGRTGMVAGLFFGLAFGMGSVGAAVLGKLADHVGIDFVYALCAFLPLIGLLAAFLPDVHKHHGRAAA